VFVDSVNDVSIIIELLEYRDDHDEGNGSSSSSSSSSSDNNKQMSAVKFIFEDLAEHNEAGNSVVEMEADLSPLGAAPLVDR